MALTLSASTTETASLADFLEHVRESVDLHDTDAVLESAPVLKALANNRSLIVDELNDEFRRAGTLDHYQSKNGYSAQTLVLGQGPGFIVRANIWLPPAPTALERASQRSLSAYQLPHDHDFSFMTVGYWGSGYATSIWEYDAPRVVGRVQEPVELTFLEHTTLPQGKVMFYRASKDVHSQEYPQELSVSLNLLLLPQAGPTSQYMFDPDAGVISGIVPNGALNRVSLCLLAQHIGNDETADRLDQLTVTHPEPRLRWAAYESLAALKPSAAESLLERASLDVHEFVRGQAIDALHLHGTLGVGLKAE